MERLHIDAAVKVTRGEDAEELLVAQNDAASVGESGGIERVDEDRWLLAQECERRHWFGSEKAAADDHNYVNYLDFAGYQALAGMRFPRAIELGCGPFTNMRYVARCCDLGTVELLDPLLNDYLGHPNRWFDADRLYMAPGWSRYQAIHRRAPWVWRRAAPIARRTVPIGALHPVAIESFKPPHSYDLVVIVNVLEHCRDIDAIFAAIHTMIAPGGVLAFGDIGFDAAELREVGQRQWDAAHPLRPLTSAIDGFLAEFEPLFDARRPAAAGLYQQCTFRNFIGRARHPTPAGRRTPRVRLH